MTHKLKEYEKVDGMGAALKLAMENHRLEKEAMEEEEPELGVGDCAIQESVLPDKCPSCGKEVSSSNLIGTLNGNTMCLECMCRVIKELRRGR